MRKPTNTDNMETSVEAPPWNCQQQIIGGLESNLRDIVHPLSGVVVAQKRTI